MDKIHAKQEYQREPIGAQRELSLPAGQPSGRQAAPLAGGQAANPAGGESSCSQPAGWPTSQAYQARFGIL